jgi:hypothetical protein
LATGALLLPFAGPASAATGAVLYASPSGTGSACTLAAPCSLDEAQDAVRAVNGAMSADITVYLRGGTYRLPHTFTLDNRDSGSNGHTVHWAAYPGESPVLSGARKVGGFQLYDGGRGIYRARVPAGTQSRQLFVNDVRAQRARSALNPGGFTLSGSSFTTSDPSYASFTNQSQVEVVDDNAWKQMRCPLQSITATSGGGSSLNIAPGCFADNNTDVPNPGYPLNGAGLPRLDNVSWIENAYQLLTQPGQFYLDTNAGYLYYIPRAGENLATADVELPMTQELLDLSGTPGHLAPVDDSDPNAVYTGSWSINTGRPYGDLGAGVHYTMTDGDSVSYTFTGTGVQVLSEINGDEGGIDVYVDGVRTQSVSAYGTTRLAQQPLVTVTSLAKGQHTVRLVKTSGTYMLVDGFTVVPDTVQPVHDVSVEGLTFAYTTWNQPTVSGYVDNQAGVLWAPGTQTPIRIPAAVQVHRGNRVSFTGDTFAHLGGTGIDLADGTQQSTVAGSVITDTSGGGVSLGEVDDYYQNRTDLMTTGDAVHDNTVTAVGQDYQDAVGIWAGYTRDAVIAHNEVGYTPYSGISLGWGWGWASCTLIASDCHHGTIYAGGNQITGNWVHDVMRTLNDGGPIYTNGGQGGGDSSMTSVLADNLVSEGNHTNNMLYQDEGSSSWDTHDNVVRFGGSNWICMWIPTIHAITVHDNWSDNASYCDNGTGITFSQATVVSGGAWPAAAQQIIAAAGPAQQYRATTGPIDDDSTALTYTGSWFNSAVRGYGDYWDGVHATSNNGDSVTLSFTGTGVAFLTETNADEGTIQVSLDGASQGTVNAYAATRHAQQQLYAVSGLPNGPHTLTLTKAGGSYLVVDRFDVS